MDLAGWKKHIAHVAADEGQWVGVLDENGLPLYELGGVVSANFPRTRLASSSVDVTVAVSPGDRVVEDLVGPNLGVTDDEGRLVPASGPTRLLMLVRENGERNVATIVHVVASGENSPSQLVINGVDLLDGLAWWPCPSIPLEWPKAEFTQWTTDASGDEYSTARTLAQVPIATRADGYTKRGPAVTVIRDLIQESFDAVNGLYGWLGDPHAVVAYTAGEDTSPEVFIRVNDDPILDTVSESARAAGVTLHADLWWPGDAPVRVKTSRDPEAYATKTWEHPIQVFHVNPLGKEL